MELWIGALNLGFLYAFMTLGVLITFRIQDFPDITVDGSFTSGAAVAAVLIISGINPFVALIGSFIIGAIAGAITGIIYTKLKINGLLAGILVMIGLYSINLHIMGRSNIPLLNEGGFADFIQSFNPGIATEIWFAIIMFAVIIVVWFFMSKLFMTDLGITFRATGDNKTMTSASGINVNRMEIFGIAISNGLVGISGGLVAQYQGFADIGMGIGTVVIGLASVIIGEAILRIRSIYAMVFSAIVGSIVFRLMIAFALFAGMDPIDLKLLTALFVLLTLFITKMIGKKEVRRRGLVHIIQESFAHNKKIAITSLAIIVAAVGIFSLLYFDTGIIKDSSNYKIGIVQISDHPVLNVTRDSFIEEMENLGYKQGENVEYILKDANGDMSILNSIVDKFINEKVDLILPISTPATQAVINKVDDIPVVFATVANPFIIDAGKSETDHRENVTGVYGWVPMDKSLHMVKKILNKKPLKIGALWDPAHANSVFNVEQLQDEAEKDEDVLFVGQTITNSSEVYQAAISLVEKDIDIFLLPPDNIVFSALESVIKAARPKKIPIWISDLERLGSGVFGGLGYDYHTSGRQAANIVKRIFNGEKVKDIPFEKYTEIITGIDIKVAEDYGINVPDNIISRMNRFSGIELKKPDKMPKIGIVQFAMEPNVELAKEGIINALKYNGYVDGENIEIIYKNANADFSMINSIMQDFIRREVDIITPLSTPCVQSAVQLAAGKEKPYVIFTYIFNPYKIGAAKSPSDHYPNMTGVSCFPPIEKILDMIKNNFPDKKKVGIVWNSSEANSEAVTDIVKQYASKIGLEIIEQTVTNPSEVLEASKSIANRGAEVFLNAGDNTLNVSFDSFVKVARSNNIPVISVDSELLENGSTICLGPDYLQTGFDGGQYIARVLDGEHPKDMPITQTEETLLYLNMDEIEKNNIKIKKDLIKNADKLYRKETKESSGNKKKVALFQFNDAITINHVADAVIEEFKESGMLEKHNLKIDRFNAQNEFSMAQTVAQDIIRQKYDYIITLSTPALQVMSNENKKIPHIFGYVTDPYRMGVAESPEKHQENITGIQTFQPVESTFKMMRKIFPNAKKVGIIWNPAEACSEACTEKSREYAKKYGFTLIEKTVSSTSEIHNALTSLISEDIELFLTSGDNTVGMAIESIANTLKEKQIPYFTNTPSDVKVGAFLGLGADYNEVGRETARCAFKVIRGENPKDIEIINYVPEKYYINEKLAKKYGLNINKEIIEKASFVKR